MESTWAILAISTIAVFAAIVLLLRAFWSTRYSPFGKLAYAQLTMWHYLAFYVVLRVPFLSSYWSKTVFWASSTAQWPSAYMMVVQMLWFLLSPIRLAAIFLLACWIYDYFRRNRESFFQEFYLAGGTIQEASKPLLLGVAALELSLSLMNAGIYVVRYWGPQTGGVAQVGTISLAKIGLLLLRVAMVFDFAARRASLAYCLVMIWLADSGCILATSYPVTRMLGISQSSNLDQFMIFLVSAIPAFYFYRSYLRAPREGLLPPGQ